MKFTDEGIEATHAEMIDWLKYNTEQMARANVPRDAIGQWASMTAMWLSKGAEYLRRHEAKCNACGGTGKSKLALGHGGEAECTWCKGTGLRHPIEGATIEEATIEP